MAEGYVGDVPENAGVKTASDNKENILNAAVKFLQNPVVQKTSLTSQETFLRNKGLTEEEVKTALQRVSSLENNMVLPVNHSNVSVPPPVPTRIYNSAPHSSNGPRFKDFINNVVLFCGFTYGVYQFYKKYLHHIWFSEDEEKERKKRRNEIMYSSAIEELRLSVKEINDTLKSVKDQQRKQLSEAFATAKQVEDLKSEITSVKSLLLGRNQFAPPVLQTMLVPPSIPTWQLLPGSEDSKGHEAETTQDCKDDTELEARTSGSGSSENDMVTTNESDSSLEMISKNTY